VTVVSGTVFLSDSAIADGTDVFVLTRDSDETPSLSAEELAELEAGLAEADRGDMISGDELLLQLRRHGSPPMCEGRGSAGDRPFDMAALPPYTRRPEFSKT